MAYNLPPAWDPGYALPDNVVDEGLQRRAFITKQMPRGSYDNPSVGTAGYAVPKYVLDEGYGQGTYVTKWQPSGTYSGPRIPNWLNQRPQVLRAQRLPGGGEAVTVQPLGDDPMPEPYESYGQQAAQVLLSQVAKLPRSRRATALKAIMDKVDPSLWSRTQTIWNRYRKQGMDPAQAMPLALARALSAGLAAEIVTAGIRGTAPQAQSLLGLGCYGCAAALGAIDIGKITGGPIFTGGGGTATPVATPGTIATAAPGVTTDANGCQTMDGWTWVAGVATTTGTVPGHWARLQPGQTPVPFCPNQTYQPGTSTAVVRDKRTMGVQISPTENFAYPFMFRPDIPLDRVRDFSAPADIMVFGPDIPDALFERYASIANMHVMREIPEPWLEWMKDSMLTPASWKDSSFKWDPANDVANAGPEVAKQIAYWYDLIGIKPGQTIYGNSHGLPQATVLWPVTHETVGLYWELSPLDVNAPASAAATNPAVVKFRISKIPEQSLMYSVEQFFARIVDLVEQALDDLGKLACGVFGGPAGPAAGAAASSAVGVGPTVGVAGAAIAKNACGMQAPPPAPASSSILPIALITGGAVLAVALITRRRRRKKTP